MKFENIAIRFDNGSLGRELLILDPIMNLKLRERLNEEIWRSMSRIQYPIYMTLKIKLRNEP